MVRYREIIAYVLLTSVISGCTDEIKVFTPGPSIPVVYGVLDIRDTIHYVKLSKTFGGNDDPVILASDPENIFFQDAIVYLRPVGVLRKIMFESNQGQARDSGYFPPLPNLSYQSNAKLKEGRYDLVIIIPETADTLTTRFVLMDSFWILNPRPGFRKFYFYEDPIPFTWNKDELVGLYEIAFSLTYQEVLIKGDTLTRVYCHRERIIPESLEQSDYLFNYYYYSDPFFADMQHKIKKDPKVNFRKPIDFSFSVTAIDTTLARYLDWYNLITDDKINPNGNIPGAIGVIGSKETIHYKNLTLSPVSQDSLTRGRYTGHLGFVINWDW